MRLLDLEPGLYTYNGSNAGIYFWCPCPKCRDVSHRVRLTCKWIVIPVIYQMYIFADLFGIGHPNIVPSKAETCWHFEGTGFTDLSITPSLDASKSGHWHGHVSNGNIT